MTQTKIEAVPWMIAMEGRLGGLFGDPDFLEVHRRMSPFNLFEAVGAIRGELRHSNFRGYLLSPSRSHGLGARPLASFLRRVLSRMPPLKRPTMSGQKSRIATGLGLVAFGVATAVAWAVYAALSYRGATGLEVEDGAAISVFPLGLSVICMVWGLALICRAKHR